MEELKQFLIKAKKKTYASLLSKPRRLPRDGKLYQIKKGEIKLNKKSNIIKNHQFVHKKILHFLKHSI